MASRLRRRRDRSKPGTAPAPPASGRPETPPFDIAPNDPVLAYFQSAAGAVDIGGLQMDSPGLEAMRAAGVKLVVPLVAQGALIGLLTLGPRLSEQDYSTDDHRLLDSLAGQAAPALRVAQLVKEQEAQARNRERVEQELRVARLIQENLLPKHAPEPPGWQIAAHYRAARFVGGDFYDFIELRDGRLGLVIGDVTDKGVPAALVMASTRSVLISAAERFSSPGEVLGYANNRLCPDMPPNMFVTCFYAVLEPATGRVEYANAGHNLPYVRTPDSVGELRATGMPLGLMPDIVYEQREATIGPGETLLLHSDGLAEAHDPAREMFGFPRMAAVVRGHEGGSALIDVLLTELARFTGPEWEQEDDVTLVTLQRSAFAGMAAEGAPGRPGERDRDPVTDRTLLDVDLPSARGNERQAINAVAASVAGVAMPAEVVERLKTAVAEAVMNAMEHGNEFDPSRNVHVVVRVSGDALTVSVTDHGGGAPIPEAQTPDLDAKLAGDQSPRGWGLFLMKNMVDDVRVVTDDTHHTVELVMRLGGP